MNNTAAENAGKKLRDEREPLLRIMKRHDMPTWQAWTIRGVALVIALLVCGIFISAVGGISMFEGFKLMWEGTFGNMKSAASIRIRCWDTAFYATKLLCIAAGLAVAFKMRFWNIGAEGQVIIGGLVTAFFMRNLAGTMPNVLLCVLMVIASIAAGALWAFIPAVCNAKWGTNETLFTLMMNYVAIKLTDSCVNAWKGLNPTLPSFNSDTKIGWMPQIFGQDAALPIFVFLAVAIVMYVYMTKTKQGYDITVVGESHNTARYAGINVKKVIIRTMIISGAVCGLCGAMTVSGYSHNINSATVANGYGFTAIIVAWLSKFNTIGMIFTSLLIVFLERGTNQLGNAYAAFGTGAGQIMIGLVLFFIIGSEFFINYSVKLRKKQAAAAEEAAK